MRAFKLGIAVGAVTVAVALPVAVPAGAQAEAVVPPGNSAANQYTETAPGAGGEQLPPGGHTPSPVKTLGTGTAEKLDELGPAGRATAALAAAGAPRRSGRDSDGIHGNGEKSGSGGAGEGRGGKGDTGPAGSSGLGRVLGQATGLSSAGSQSGLLLLAFLATGLWSIVYLWRRRGRAV